MIAVVAYALSLISTSTSVTDDFPILNRLNCSSCPSVYVPVCTTNDLTFTNECRVQCYNDLLRKMGRNMVYVAYYGTCVSSFVQVGVQVPDNMNGDAYYE